MNLYYKIWVDLIVLAKNNPLRKEDWKWMVQIYMAMAIAIKLAFIMSIVQRNILDYYFYNLDVFNNQVINNFFSFFILFFLPPVVINYLLIFKDNKYQILIKQYKSYNGKLFAAYFFISFFIPLIFFMTAFLLK
jgi:hypothetical protein